MQQRRHQQHQALRNFTASEVAEFEHCPLAWWHQQYDPLAQADTEEVFARLVELEHEHGLQATALPEYRVGEQLLLRRGAFDHGQSDEQSEEIVEIEHEPVTVANSKDRSRLLLLIAGGMLLGALVLITVSVLAILSRVGYAPRIGNVLLPVGLGLLMLAVMLLLLLFNEHRTQHHRLLKERHNELGLPVGELVYEDADGLGEMLSSNEYPLVGKPDYIVQLPDGRAVPIELKPSIQDATEPYSSHAAQVAAYCLILEDYFESPPTHAILRYADRDFTVEYTPTLRKKVIRLLTEMDRCNEVLPPPLGRQRAAKCRVCTFQPICPVGRKVGRSSM